MNGGFGVKPQDRIAHQALKALGRAAKAGEAHRPRGPGGRNLGKGAGNDPAYRFGQLPGMAFMVPPTAETVKG